MQSFSYGSHAVEDRVSISHGRLATDEHNNGHQAWDFDGDFFEQGQWQRKVRWQNRYYYVFGNLLISCWYLKCLDPGNEGDTGHFTW